MGNGKRQFKLVASGLAGDFSHPGQLLQGGADNGGANAAEFAQLLHRNGVTKPSESLADPLHRGRFGSDRSDGILHHRKGSKPSRFESVVAGYGPGKERRDVQWTKALDRRRDPKASLQEMPFLERAKYRTSATSRDSSVQPERLPRFARTNL